MSTIVNKIENILTSEYSTANYVELMQEIFNSMKLVAPNNFRPEFSNFSNHIKGSIHVGNYLTPDRKKIAIFAVQLKKETYVENSRSTQRSYAKKLIVGGNCDAAIVAFFTEEDLKWRLSFVRLDYEMKIENGKLKQSENLTPAKRYSFLVGKNEPCHTAIDRFRQFIISQNFNPTLDDIEDAFSVEKVTDEFFNRYCEKFHQLREQLEAIEDFRIEAEQHNFTSAQFAKKLMGQIVFLYFLQKKGWLGVKAWPETLNEKEYKNAFYARGAKSREMIPIVYRPVGDGTYKISGAGLNSISDADEEVLAMCVKGKPWGSGPHDFMRKLFNIAVQRKVNFYNELLEPLFYDALNRNRGEQGYCPALHCRIPFLSGGLFEPIDGYDWEHNQFDIPNDVFSNASTKGRDADGILDIFDRYNFTISEDEPMEREVAIDPEMLGKVFENLLEIKDRKSKGAFYTPREIVHYMCQESLINYLTNALSISEDAIRDFILYGDFMKDEDTVKEKRQGNGGMYISEELYKINPDGTVAVNRLLDLDKALKDVRVADPAVGSGAFPLGMLNEIVRARQNISAYLAITKSNKDKHWMYQMERSPHTLKYETIRNCIFACDIEPSAVDIAQLRLWLALVIDDEINPNAQTPLDGHRNPLPLPNLESNILCGNSLIDEFEGIRLVKESDLLGSSDYQRDLNSDRFDSIILSLIQTQDELFRCDNTDKKKQLKEQIEALRDMIIQTQLEGCEHEKIQRYYESARLASKPYILWQLDFARVFREKGGFDIVIGNPPYVSTKGVSADDKKKYERIFGFSDDTYSMFTFKGLSITAKRGSTNYIIPKTFWTTQTKRNMRDLILDNTIGYIYDTANPFESAMVDTCIIQVINCPFAPDHTIRFMDGSKDLFAPVRMMVEQNVYRNTQNSVIFKPTDYNMRIYQLYGQKVKELYDTWWDKIKTSKDIEKNKRALEEYRRNLKPGDVALLGCLTEGGQGLATANNGRYIAVRKSTKWAKNIIVSRPVKLADAMKINKIPLSKLAPYTSADDMFARASDAEIASVFDRLKEEYGRDIFGQGYIYRLIDDDELADVASLTQDEKENGIDTSKCYYVPYDKGDKDGNRWYLETPFAIAWSRENVRFLKTNSGKKGAGMPVVRNPQFNFREGFCWSDINTTYLKCRLKGRSINDVKSMSLYGLTELVPERYIVSLINSSFISLYVDTFVNNTQTFQINDARQLPIIVPTDDELSTISEIFNKAVEVKQRFFAGKYADVDEINDMLDNLQIILDNTVLRLYKL